MPKILRFSIIFFQNKLNISSLSSRFLSPGYVPSLKKILRFKSNKEVGVVYYIQMKYFQKERIHDEILAIRCS